METVGCFDFTPYVKDRVYFIIRNNYYCNFHFLHCCRSIVCFFMDLFVSWLGGGLFYPELFL